MSNPSQITIEENIPFSQSKIWSAQREFYDQKGIEAWAGDVPFYITSNPFIANNYAHTVIRFIQDWIRKYPESKNHPFYVLELGTGSGQFSFYVLKKLFNLHSQLNMQEVKIQYIMTDFTKNNLEFWKSHGALKPFLQNQLLDFAVFDLENDTTINLTNSNMTLQPGSINNPLIVFANYLFDTIVTDIFTIKNNELSESLVTLKTFEKNLKNNTPIKWEKVKITHNQKKTTDQYYDNEEINQILFEYPKMLKDTHLPFPIGSLRCVQHLNEISQNKLLLITSDKGYAALEELEELDYPSLDFHGSFSVMANLHAIGQYFKMKNGDYFYQTHNDSITSAVFSSGIKFNDLPETKLVLQQTIEGFTPSDYFIFYEHFEKNYKQTKLEVLISLLNFSDWDPFVFDTISSRLIDLVKDADDEPLDYLANNIHKVADHFYYVPECDDVFFSIGLFLYEIDQYEDAIKYYKKSEKYFGAEFEIFFNIGLCYFYSEQYDPALEYFNKALHLQPNAKSIKDLIKKSQREMEKV